MLKEKTSDVSMTNTNQGSGTAAEAAVPMSHGLWNTWRKNLLLFCLTGVYVELCLHLCVFGSMDRYAGYPVLFGMLGGALCTLVVSSLPKVLRQITGVFLVAAQVLLAEVQLVYHCIFGDFMPVSQIGMGGNVVVNFNSQLLYGIRQNLLKILLLLLPLIVVILCLALRRGQALKLRLRWKQAMASFAVLLALLLTVTGLMYVGRDNAFSVYRTFTNVNTSTDSSYKKIGMLATTVQELRYMLFSGSGSIMITPSSLNMSDVPRTYSSNSYNVIESIDFTALADSTDSDILKATDEYLSNATPTRKNNYTGLLKDYNLITICAESFCPWFISEELTPTLYKLSHTGILFENYYGTFQSVTTNGEYTMCMGLYPDMSRTKTDSSFNVAGTNYLPFCLAGTDVLSSGLHAAVLSDKSFLTKTFRYDAGTETAIPADESITVSDKLVKAYRLYVDSRFQLSGNILNSDYYAHVFARESSGGSLADTVVFTDIKSIFNQASVLYMYRKGYVDPETPDTFGGKATARLGEFIDVLYRIAGRPETDNTALPADYENEEFNAAHPYYNAVCWAYQTRLLRQNDPNAEYDDKVDYQTACVLIRRYAIMAGVDTGVDQTQLRQLLRDAPDLGREAAKAMLWCDEKDITTRDSSLDELLASAGTRISRYQMTSFLFYLCTYELDIGS